MCAWIAPVSWVPIFSSVYSSKALQNSWMFGWSSTSFSFTMFSASRQYPVRPPTDSSRVPKAVSSNLRMSSGKVPRTSSKLMSSRPAFSMRFDTTASKVATICIRSADTFSLSPTITLLAAVSFFTIAAVSSSSILVSSRSFCNFAISSSAFFTRGSIFSLAASLFASACSSFSSFSCCSSSRAAVSSTASVAAQRLPLHPS
mmetsp:Transcript_2566/g.7205  ORF Transcript_2566/g.7205 Transcript_2566/m.7205 type:complete len:202 (-) Transcript_2566:46-651(-)